MPQLALRRDGVDVPNEYNYILDFRVPGTVSLRTAAGRNPAIWRLIEAVRWTWLTPHVDSDCFAIHLSAEEDNGVRTIRVCHPRKRIEDS
jgi:hypothetical protein